MTPEQFERLEQMLQTLEPEIKTMPQNAQAFVRDQIDRVEKWGVNIRMSPKQMDWLEGLYRKHVGELPEDTARDDTLDDEIPF